MSPKKRIVNSGVVQLFYSEYKLGVSLYITGAFRNFGTLQTAVVYITLLTCSTLLLVVLVYFHLVPCALLIRRSRIITKKKNCGSAEF